VFLKYPDPRYVFTGNECKKSVYKKALSVTEKIPFILKKAHS